MKTDHLKTKVEVFICNHERDDRENCYDKGAKDLTDDLKKWSKEKHKGDIKVFRSGCLGKCSEGIAIACYPEKKFYLDVEPGDSDKIKKKLEETLEDLKDN